MLIGSALSSFFSALVSLPALALPSSLGAASRLGGGGRSSSAGGAAFTPFFCSSGGGLLRHDPEPIKHLVTGGRASWLATECKPWLHNNTMKGDERETYLESLPEEPDEDELSELDPEALLDEAGDFSRSSSGLPAMAA